MPDGLRSMRVIIEGGVRPRPGDPVDIYATFDPQTVGDDVEPTLTVAHAVPGDRGRLATTRRAPASTGAAIGVTVLVTPDEAKRLAFADRRRHARASPSPHPRPPPLTRTGWEPARWSRYPPAVIEAVIFDYGGVFSSPLFRGIGKFEADMGYPPGAVLELLFGDKGYIGVEGWGHATDDDAAEPPSAASR